MRTGLGQAHATLISQGFMLWCFITPLIGAAIANQYLGRMKTIICSSLLYLFGLMILLVPSTQTSHNVSLSVPVLVFALWTVGLGTGGIKTNVSSPIAEQYIGTKEGIRVLKSGEKVVVDKKLTIQR
jgi:POT family proton-dependent oligopeptide transporter